jgi:hypothetical protein
VRVAARTRKAAARGDGTLFHSNAGTRPDLPPTRTVDRVNPEPLDPFAGDPDDPASRLPRVTDEEEFEPLTVSEREEVVGDLGDLEVFRSLLEPRGTRGLVVDCDECEEPHYFDWDLLIGNLRHLLEAGHTRVHEPAFEPDPSRYVSWEYARGYADGVLEASEDSPT